MKIPYTVHRKVFGVLLVAASGFAYGLISQTINALFLPGIPLYQPPFGILGNILMAVLIGISLGFLVASSETGAVGVLWGSFLGALFVSVATMLTGQVEDEIFWRKIVAITIAFIPIAAILAPLLILFRWAIGREEDAYRNAGKGLAPTFLRRYALPASLVLGAGLLGLFSLYSDVGRAVTPRMDALIKQGRQASRFEMLPEPLRDRDVRYFFEHKNQPYRLAWDKDSGNRYAIPRPAGSGYDTSIVIARYEDGYLLVCMFPGKTGEPSCKDFLPYNRLEGKNGSTAGHHLSAAWPVTRGR